MNILLRSSYLLILLLFATNVSSQNIHGSAVLCGRIIFDQDSFYPYKPYSIILQKDWPITFQQFEQQEIDSTNYSFKIKIDLNQITYGNIIVNFFQEIDSTTLLDNRSWISSIMLPSLRGSNNAALRNFVSVKLIC
jgi:hypothetical protein